METPQSNQPVINVINHEMAVVIALAETKKHMVANTNNKPTISNGIWT